MIPSLNISSVQRGVDAGSSEQSSGPHLVHGFGFERCLPPDVQFALSVTYTCLSQCPPVHAPYESINVYRGWRDRQPKAIADDLNRICDKLINIGAQESSRLGLLRIMIENLARCVNCREGLGKPAISRTAEALTGLHDACLWADLVSALDPELNSHSTRELLVATCGEGSEDFEGLAQRIAPRIMMHAVRAWVLDRDLKERLNWCPPSQ